MARITKRKNYEGKARYQVTIRLKGTPTQTATFIRLTDAKKWAQQTEAAIREGRHFKTSESKRRTTGEMIDRYIEKFQPPKTKKAHLLWWKEVTGCYLLSDLSPALIAEKRDILLNTPTYKGTKRSPSTVVRYMASLSHVLTVTVKEFGWLESSPMTKVVKPKEPEGRVRFLSDEERESLLKTCQNSDHPYLYLVVILALSTGMRKSEILTLRWSQVDLSRKQVLLEKTKNRSRRLVPLGDLPLKLLTLHLQKRGSSSLLFPGKDPRTPMDLRRAWVRALKEAEIENFRFHDLRHSAASYMAMSGSSLAEIGILLGHKRLEVTKRYAHLSQKHLSQAVETMNANIFK